jgi:putative transposase
MTRPLRLEFPGALYHVTARGDRREPIVEDDVDRVAWVGLLGWVCQRFRWRVHAWVLMGNHYHLLLETPDARLSEGMRQLNGVWSQHFNRRHGRVGHVFQGRFKAIFVERESYLLELARYVVLNPARAHMVTDVADYAWSSYGTMMGQPDPALAAVGAAQWLDTAALLQYFASESDGPEVARVAMARQRYRHFVREGVGLPSVW